MQKRMDINLPVTMIPPIGQSRLGELCRLAMEGLERAHFGKVVEPDVFVAAYLQSKSLKGGRLLVIDEDPEGDGLNMLKKHGVDPDHHLILADLGLKEDDDLGPDALRLLKDGIEAECVLVGDQVPGARCPCSFTF